MRPLDSRLSDSEYRLLEHGIDNIEKTSRATIPTKELFGALSGQSGKHRSDRWMASVNHGLTQLSANYPLFDFDAIHQNRAFHNVMKIAAEYAGGCRQPEKLAVLRSAVLNAALPDAPEERAQIIYLKIIDIFTPWHYRLLRAFSHVSLIDAKEMDSQLPPVVKQPKFYENLVNDLAGLGLVFIKKNEGRNRTIQEIPVITDQGRRFLHYISSPLSDE